MDDFSNYFGLFGYPEDETEPRRVKKTWEAFRDLSQVVGDARFARDLSPELNLPDDVYVLGFLREDDSRLLAVWDGREKGDIIEGTEASGGMDTTYALSLPLPEDVAEAVIIDSSGAEESRYVPEAEEDSPTLEVTLDIHVRYIELH